MPDPIGTVWTSSTVDLPAPCRRVSGPRAPAVYACGPAHRRRGRSPPQELESYLGQLEQVQVSLDGGTTMLNFAEAALLIQVCMWPLACALRLRQCVMRSTHSRILGAAPAPCRPSFRLGRKPAQGTTCVYSRKVEYLHRLVLQVLDVIDHKLSKELRKDAAAEGEHDVEGAFPSDPDFISLDDIPEAQSCAIDMAEKPDKNRDGDDEEQLTGGGPMVIMMNMEVDSDNPVGIRVERLPPPPPLFFPSPPLPASHSPTFLISPLPPTSLPPSPHNIGIWARR